VIHDVRLDEMKKRIHIAVFLVMVITCNIALSTYFTQGVRMIGSDGFWLAYLAFPFGYLTRFTSSALLICSAWLLFVWPLFLLPSKIGCVLTYVSLAAIILLDALTALLLYCAAGIG